MEYRPLGTSGLLLSALSLGTATFGGASGVFRHWGQTQLDEARRLIDMALQAGINCVDTADVYSAGASEEILGRALQGRRDDLLICTKAGFRTGPGPNDLGHSRQHLIAACEASLRRLGTDRIDLWLLHSFDALTPLEETLHAMEHLLRAGKVRYIGCSNHAAWQLMKALSVSERHGWSRFVLHQAHYCLANRDFEWELMPLALDQGLGTVVWSPLAGGLLSGKVGRGRPAPAGSRVASGVSTPHRLSPEQLFTLTDALEAIARETGHSVAQIALRWVMQRPSVTSVVLGARDEAQLKQNLAACHFHLDADQMRRLDEASASPLPYPVWHQQKLFAERNPRPS